MKSGKYIMTHEPISTAYFVNLSHQSVRLYVHPSLVARQRLGKHPPIIARKRFGENITTATNIHKTKELLDESFYVRPMSYEGK
jgi:hypothetical protein